MSEERFSQIEYTIKDLSQKVQHLDKSFGEMNVSLKDYVGWTKQLEKTIRSLDDTVKNMHVSHQQIPYDRLRDIQSYIDPVHAMLRKHEEHFISKTHAHTISAVSVFFLSSILIILGAFGNYILDDMKNDIINTGNTNKKLIIKNAESLRAHMIDSARK